MIDSHVLVLNRFFFPIDTTSVKRAFLMLYGGSAKAVNLDYETFDFNSWSEISATNEDDCIKTVSTVIKILQRYIFLQIINLCQQLLLF